MMGIRRRRLQEAGAGRLPFLTFVWLARDASILSASIHLEVL